MRLVDQLRREHNRVKQESSGSVKGIYLVPERSSKVQFPILFLSDGKCTADALQPLEVALDALYASNGFANVNWYIERSFGMDVNGTIAWENLDITDLVVP